MAEQVKWMAPKEYAEMMGLNEVVVRRMCDRGSLNAQKVGGRWRIAYTEPGAVSAANAHEILTRTLTPYVDALEAVASVVTAAKKELLKAMEGDSNAT